jgi:hypothetical protein
MSALDIEVEPGPLPFEEGEPDRGEMWCPGGAPPTGLEFLDCRGTLMCWVVPCPACLEGWSAVLPDGTEFGYRLAHEYGCSLGCEPPDVLWCHLLRCGILPPRPEPGERARCYALAAARRELAEVAQRPTLAQLKSTGYRVGQWLAAGALDVDSAAQALVGAAQRAGLADQILTIADAVTAGRAKPARVPA